ncbi:Predicted acetyltransferase [Mycobacteroides abscessus subsp. abscessus]|nr:Predicted acetyltransferase [Mycobacteroides abscessus subsp. abscessus]HEO8418491.1 GNAT family N-acetyltransferase [Yersinia enterocolitica]
MKKYMIKQIKNLMNFELDSLVEHSMEDGFRFVERLVKDYKNEINTFNHFGEILFGVFDEADVLIAIGGLNQDPFSRDQSIGRLRRVYVRKEFRREGIGGLLVKKIMVEARNYYKILVLHTDTEQADNFYISIGFSKSNLYSNASHYIELKR